MPICCFVIPNIIFFICDAFFLENIKDEKIVGINFVDPQKGNPTIINDRILLRSISFLFPSLMNINFQRSEIKMPYENIGHLLLRSGRDTIPR